MPRQRESAEERFRRAFERLKAGKPEVLPKGTPVSQNNVAKEAGKDPSALKAKRFPELIKHIQDYVREHGGQEREDAAKAKVERREAREDLEARLERVTKERDIAQSKLTSAHRQIVELWEEKAELQMRVDAQVPPPANLNGERPKPRSI